MRLLLAALLAGTLAGALAVPALAAGGDPQKAHTLAGAVAAQKPLLKASDFPKGWKAKAATSVTANGACRDTRPNLSDLTEIGSADSPDFNLGQLEAVSQTVRVYRTATQAQTAYSRTVTIGLVSCLAKQLEAASSAKAKVTITGQARLPLAKLADQADGFRVVAHTTVKSEKEQFDVYAYVIVIRKGATISTISVAAFRQPADALGSQLARLVATRLGGKPATA